MHICAGTLKMEGFFMWSLANGKPANQNPRNYEGVVDDKENYSLATNCFSSSTGRLGGRVWCSAAGAVCQTLSSQDMGVDSPGTLGTLPSVWTHSEITYTPGPFSSNHGPQGLRTAGFSPSLFTWSLGVKTVTHNCSVNYPGEKKKPGLGFGFEGQI